MTDQLDFDLLLPPSVPVDTSEEAAASLLNSVAAIRRDVLICVLASNGATCDEVEKHLGLKHQTASARLWELERMGILIKSATRRRTRSGRNAHVYVSRKG